MFEVFLQALIYGITLGIIYGIATMGLNLVWGIMRVVNFAHAEFITLGAYTAYWLWILINFNPISTIPVSGLLGFIFGMIVFYSIIYKFFSSPELMENATLVATFALGIVLAESMKVLWTADYRGLSWNLGVIKYSWFIFPLSYAYTFIISLIIIIVVYYIIYKTYLGKAIRAVIWDSGAAAICGINVKNTLTIGFSLGSALAFVGGTLIVVYLPTGINPYMGQLYLLKAFVITILGGFGNPWGALIGGILFGIIESIMPLVLAYIPGIEPLSFTPFIAFLILIVILIIRPEGILGKRR
jgi:branched-chain amino acid transport system permease protein